MEVGKRTIRDVGADGVSSGRAFIDDLRAGREDGRDVRTRHAPAREVDAAFLARRSAPTDEKGEALANTAKPRELTARFTGQNGGPITLPSGFPDERAELLAKRAAFTVQPGRLPTQQVRLHEHSEANQSCGRRPQAAA
jgi:hypothetical protein